MFVDPLGVLVSGTAVEPVTATFSAPLADARVVALPR